MGDSSGRAVPEIETTVHLPGRCSVEVRLTDTDGMQLEGVAVEAWANIVWRPEKDVPVSEWTVPFPWSRHMLQWPEKDEDVPLPGHDKGVTDVAGACKLRGISGSEITLQIGPGSSPRSSERWACKFKVRHPLAAGEERVVPFTLDRHHVLKGRVTDRQGQGIENAQIFAESRPAQQLRLEEPYGWSQGSSGDDGSFEFRAMGPAPYRLGVSAQGFDPQQLELDGKASEVLITLESVRE